jgi:Leucine-rich repeat (LRR) protein
MGLFTRRYTSLPQQLAWPSLCRRLSIYSVDHRLQEWGSQLLQLSHLQDLHLQGDSSIYDSPNFILPADIGQLRTLKSLVLLNLPIDFPEWIVDLPNLHSLTVRGTNLTTIPPWIDQMSRLRTLRVENCNLAHLPQTLRQMSNLRELGLCDTKLRDFSPAQFPPHLKQINFAGTGCYRRSDLSRLQKALKSTKIHPDPNSPGWPPNNIALQLD